LHLSLPRLLCGLLRHATAPISAAEADTAADIDRAQRERRTVAAHGAHAALRDLGGKRRELRTGSSGVVLGGDHLGLGIRLTAAEARLSSAQSQKQKQKQSRSQSLSSAEVQSSWSCALTVRATASAALASACSLASAAAVARPSALSLALRKVSSCARSVARCLVKDIVRASLLGDHAFEMCQGWRTRLRWRQPPPSPLLLAPPAHDHLVSSQEDVQKRSLLQRRL